MGTIGHLSRSASKAVTTCSTEPRPLDESMVYKRYWLDVLAALDLPHSRWHDLRHAFAVTSLAGDHYRDVSRWLSAVPCVSRRRRHEKRVPASHTPPPRYSRTTLPCCLIRSSV